MLWANSLRNQLAFPNRLYSSLNVGVNLIATVHCKPVISDFGLPLFGVLIL